MQHRVFAQARDASVDVAAIARNAARFFEADVEVLSAGSAPQGLPPELARVRLRLSSARRGYAAEFWISSRTATSEDWAAAERAEERGRAGGMASLAKRCAHIWEIEPAGPPSEAALLNLCALLASVALGPVLPPDESTLFGVRGAMERLEALTGRSLAR